MDFKDEILTDIDWRMSELASLKTIPLRYNLLPNHKEILIKYTVPSIYSLWEGYVKNIFTVYIREINNLNMPIDEAHLNVLTHTLTTIDKLSLENTRNNFQKKKEFIECYQSKVTSPLFIEPKIPTKSNVDFLVINDILNRFNLPVLPKSYEKGLKKLLKFRNSIAHGDNAIPVTIDNVTEFTMLINDLMVEIFDRVNDGFVNKTYRK